MSDIGPDHPARPAIHVQLIGPFRIADRPGSAPIELPAGKATTLAQLLAAGRGAFVATDAVVDALWPGEAPPGAAQNVASLVSRLRRALGPGAIGGGRNGYRLEAGACVFDVDEAARLVSEADAQLRAGRAALAVSAAHQAREILEGGSFLESEPYAEWAAEGRRAAEQLTRKARRAAWRAAQATGDHVAAIEAASATIAADPLDEEAHRARIRSHYLAGDAGGALAAYETLRTTLVEELGADPSPRSEALHLAMLRSEPLPADEGTTASGAPPGVGAPELAGRDRELMSLVTRWEAAAGGEPGVLAVVGAAGSGRTAVAGELATRARATGAAVLRSTCHQAERSLFLQPVLDALRDFLGALQPAQARDLAGEWSSTLGELLPELRGLLGGRPYERATPEIEHRRSLEAVAGMIRSAARRQPVLVILDDVHHAGESTLEALHFVARRLVGDRVLIVVTATSDAADEVLAPLGERVDVVSMGPLALAAVGELASRLGLSALSAADVLERTGGNARFVVEALRLAAEGGAGTHPESLEAAVLARVRRVGRDVEDLLRVAAVVGGSFELDFVAELASIQVEEAAERTDRALRAGLLTTEGSRFVFAGAAIRDALYATTPAPIRASRHRRAAGWLTDRPEAAAAHHAAVGEWDQAREAWASAAEQAIRAFAIRDAERVLTEAVGAAERAGDRTALARVRMRRGQLREELADYQAAQEDHTAALAAARQLGDEALEAQALERLGWTAYYGRDSEAAGELSARATELAESAAAAPAALPSALVLAGRIRHWAGDVDGAARAYEDALAREPDEATRASALSCLGALLEHGDRFADARRTLDEASVEATRIGAFRPLLRTLFFAGLARGNLGDFGGALRALERKRRLLEEYEVHFYRARTDTLLSWVWRELGETARSHDLAEQAVAESREVEAGSLQVEQELHGLLGAADCLIVEGDEAAAAELVARAEPLLSGWLPFRWRAELRFREVRCRLVLGEAGELLDLARHRGSRKYEALALAHLGRREEAAAVAGATGSDLLVAEVAPGAQARSALNRLAGGLPAELRGRFVTEGRLARAVASRR